MTLSLSLCFRVSVCPSPFFSFSVLESEVHLECNKASMCIKEVSRVFKEVSRVFQEGFKGV